MSKTVRMTMPDASQAVPTDYVDPNQLSLEIAVGGTGKDAVLEHRAEPEIADSKTIKTLFVDTDAAELDHIPQEDKFLMTDYAASLHFDQLANNPERYDHQELVPFVGDYRAAMGRTREISTGLMTNRILGRPLLDYYATRMFAVLAAFFLMPVRALHAYANSSCVQGFQGHVQERMRLSVCFVASICGGTGSSVGQLLQNLVDYLLMHQGGFSRYHLEADLFLPGVMESKAQNPDLLRANAQAVFKENLRVITQTIQEFRLGTLTLSRDLPLRFLYLFDNINALGKVLETRRQVIQMRNLVFNLRSLGVSGQEMRSRVVDIHLESPAIYSAAGAAKFVYDVVHVLTVMGYRTGQAVVKALIESLTDEETAAAVSAWWSRVQRKFPALISVPAFQTTVKGSPLKLMMSSVIQGQPRMRVGTVVAQSIKRAQSGWTQAFTELKQQTVTSCEQVLIQQLTSILNTPGGFDVAKGMLAKLLSVYEQHHEQLQQQLELRQPQHERIRERLHQVPTHWWQRWQWNPRGAFTNSYQRYVDSLLDLVRLQAQIDTMAAQIALVKALENQRQQLLSTLSGLGQRLVIDFDYYLRQYQLNQSVAVHSVVCDHELADWYAAEAEQAKAQILADLKIVWFDDEQGLGLERHHENLVSEGKLAILSAEGIARHLDHAQQPWQHLRELSVEELLTRKDLSPIAVFAQMEQLSAPWVSLNDVKVVPASKRLIILATQTSDFFHALPTQPGVSVVASGNPYEMSMLTTWHGIDPLEHLTKSEDHERAYQQALAAGRSLHLFPDVISHAETDSEAEAPAFEENEIPF